MLDSARRCLCRLILNTTDDAHLWNETALLAWVICYKYCGWFSTSRLEMICKLAIMNSKRVFDDVVRNASARFHSGPVGLGIELRVVLVCGSCEGEGGLCPGIVCVCGTDVVCEVSEESGCEMFSVVGVWTVDSDCLDGESFLGRISVEMNLMVVIRSNTDCLRTN